MSENFNDWDHQDPKKWIAQGYIDLDDDVAFSREAEAASCFGKHYDGLQLGWIPHPNGFQIGIWFPKLYANKLWHNKISGDGKTIWEISESPSLVKKYVDKEMASGSQFGWNRIVFGHSLGWNGKLYRFKGVFELDQAATNYEVGSVWRRVADRVRTYPLK
jgi:hypothetical protein